MSVGKLEKFLEKPLDLQGTQEKTVLIVGDSKACHLQSVADYPPCDKIVWWTRPGMTMAEAERLLRKDFPDFAMFKRVHVYVWAGTCDLTIKDRRELSLRMLFDEDEQVRLFEKMKSTCNRRQASLTKCSIIMKLMMGEHLRRLRSPKDCPVTSICQNCVASTTTYTRKHYLQM